jgi:group I intron endonuclease
MRNKSPEPLIYAIVHIESGKTYIGSTCDLKNRWKAHRGELVAGTHKNRHLQSVVKKYGIESVRFEVVTHCEFDEMFALEQAFIESIPRELRFNFRVVVTSNAGMTLSEESKAARPPYKPRAPVSEEVRSKISKANKGRLKGIVRGPMSEDQKRKISATRKLQPVSHLFSPETNAARMAGIKARVGKERKKPPPKSEATIKKLSDFGKTRDVSHLNSPESRAKQSLANRGHKKSEETRIRMKNAALNRTPEHCARISAAQKARWAEKKAAKAAAQELLKS